jgi:hypothetical protein
MKVQMKVAKAQMKTLANVIVDIVRKRNIRNLVVRKKDIKNAPKIVAKVVVSTIYVIKKNTSARPRTIMKRL